MSKPEPPASSVPGTASSTNDGQPADQGRDIVPNRFPGWVLSLGVALVLVLGGWWWVANEPPEASVLPPFRAAEVDGASGEPDQTPVPGIVWQGSGTLDNGAGLAWHGPREGVTYQLSFTCSGDGGELVILIGEAEDQDGWQRRAMPCQQEELSINFIAGAGMVVEVSRPGPAAFVEARVFVVS